MKNLAKYGKKPEQCVYKDMQHIFEELETKNLDKWYYESEVEQPWITIVNEFSEKGIATKSQGATIMNLEDYWLESFSC